ncbi:MAG: DUF2520 domain-containing protein [Chloroflexi bacterium]|nr:MAG: DUF2520 domain-containing protein [Chloroflexota bacterium]
MDVERGNLPKIAIIGAGKVGSTLAIALSHAGYEIVAVASRTPTSAEKLAQRLSTVATTIHEAFIQANLTLLTVPDDAIASVALQLSDAGDALRGHAFVHTSGAHSQDSLKPLVAHGAMIGSLHPALPFASIEMALNNLPNTVYALEASSPILSQWLHDIVQALKGHIITIPEGQKSIYHVAMVIASNYTVTLYSIAHQLLSSIGASEEVAASALNTLMHATVDNLAQQGLPAALTGPLSRADIGTLQAHLNALECHHPHLVPLYIALARSTYPLLNARGVDVNKIEQFLTDWEMTNESNNS